MIATKVSLEQFKRFSADTAPAARAVCMAQAFAELTRERVDAYVRPIFDSYGFTYSGDLAEKCGLSGPLPSPKELYLCDDEPALKAFYADCDEAHRAHGANLPAGHCPALHAEHLLIVTENALIDLAEPLFGIGVHNLYGENRRKYLDLLIGAGLKAEGEKKRRRR